MYCTACGQPNPDDARFCAACGAPLSTPLPSLSDRRTAPPRAIPAHESLSGKATGELFAVREVPTGGLAVPRTKVSFQSIRLPGEAEGAALYEAFVGQVIAGYRIEKKLGQGGMGAVFLATHLQLERRVAIKVLPPVLSHDDKMTERFRTEAQTLARLDDPGIVALYDMFKVAGLFCIVMAFADGGSVLDLLRDKRHIPPRQAAELIAQAARALWRAAQRGVLHRDIKPDNLLLTAEGRVKIADFGLAKAAEASVELTKTGAMMGTPAYMSVEQWKDSRTVDHRSDLYSLGCSLYQMLTGKPPFGGPSTLNFFTQHLNEQPPDLRAFRPKLPEPLIAIVEKLMAKEADARFATGEALAVALEAFLAGEAAEAPEATVHVPSAARPRVATVTKPAPEATVETPARVPTVAKPAPEATVETPARVPRVARPAPEATVETPRVPTVARPAPEATVETPVRARRPAPEPTVQTPAPAGPPRARNAAPAMPAPPSSGDPAAPATPPPPPPGWHAGAPAPLPPRAPTQALPQPAPGPLPRKPLPPTRVQRAPRRWGRGLAAVALLALLAGAGVFGWEPLTHWWEARTTREPGPHTPDTTPPAIARIQPADGSLLTSREVELRLASEEDARVSVDGVPLAAREPGLFAGSIRLREGENLVRAVAEDPAGNAETVTVRLTVDTRPPTLRWLEPAAGAWMQAGSCPVRIASDADSVVVAGRPLRREDGVWTGIIPVLHGLDQELRAEAFDRAGHRTPGSRRISVDGREPTPTIVSPADGAAFQPGALYVTVRCEGADRVAIAGEPATRVAQVKDTWERALRFEVEGRQTIEVEAWDSVENRGRAAVTVRIDQTPPAISFLQPDGSLPLGTRTPVVEVRVEGDDVARVELDGEPATEVGPGRYRATLDLGAGVSVHTIAARAVDRADNEHTERLAIEIDTRPPTVEASAREEDGGLVLELSADEQLGRLSVDGRRHAVGGRTATVELSDTGQERLALEVHDLAGNPRALTVEVSRGAQALPGLTAIEPWAGWTPDRAQRDEATRLSQPVAVHNTQGMDFALIPAGTFRMGSPEDEDGRYSDEDLHTVTISRAYYLKATEVTQGEFAELMGFNPSYFQNAGLDAPVEQVTWYDAVMFCNKLSEAEGLAAAYTIRDIEKNEHGNITGASVEFLGVDREGYRLPTEAEWERACRAGTTTALYTGRLTIRGSSHGPELDAIAWYGGNSGVSYEGGYDSSGWPEKQFEHTRAGTHPVGQKASNGWGLFDMIGNVREWCGDWYDSDGYVEGARDPVGPETGEDRVGRGGSWISSAGRCRSAGRDWDWPRVPGGGIGVRPARCIP